MQVSIRGIILAGREGNHVVECSYFPRSRLRWNGLWTLCLHNSKGLPEIAMFVSSLMPRSVLTLLGQHPRLPNSEYDEKFCYQAMQYKYFSKQTATYPLIVPSFKSARTSVMFWEAV